LKRNALYGNPVCTGVPLDVSDDFTTWAFTELEAGNCRAVWGGFPSNILGFNALDQPALRAAATFFRTADASTL